MNLQIFPGGPLLTKDDGHLIGIVSFGMFERGVIHTNVYAYVPYYYEWIESVTGLKVPKCDGPQAQSIFSFEDRSDEILQ